MLAVKARVGLFEHIQHLVGLRAGVMEARTHLRAQLADALGEAVRGPASLHRHAPILQDGVERFLGKLVQQFPAARLQPPARGTELLGRGIVRLLLALEFRARLFDQFAVLAGQMGELDEFVAGALDACRQVDAALLDHGVHFAADGMKQHVAPCRNDLVREQVFQGVDS